MLCVAGLLDTKFDRATTSDRAVPSEFADKRDAALNHVESPPPSPAGTDVDPRPTVVGIRVAIAIAITVGIVAIRIRTGIRIPVVRGRPVVRRGRLGPLIHVEINARRDAVLRAKQMPGAKIARLRKLI